MLVSHTNEERIIKKKIDVIRNSHSYFARYKYRNFGFIAIHADTNDRIVAMDVHLFHCQSTYHSQTLAIKLLQTAINVTEKVHRKGQLKRQYDVVECEQIINKWRAGKGGGVSGKAAHGVVHDWEPHR